MSWNLRDNQNIFVQMTSNMEFHLVVHATLKTSPEKLTLTVVEMQQKPEIIKTDSEEKNDCLK